MSQAVSEPELTPSDIARPEPSFARILGMLGLGCVVLGTAAAIANQFGPRWIPASGGYLFAAVGLFFLLFHAARDTDLEVRRLYGMFAALLLVVGLVVSIIPGPLGESTEKHLGHYLLPWGALSGLLGLVFAIPFVRHEDEEKYRTAAQYVILGIGGLLCVGSIIAGLVKPDALVGPGVVLALIGLGFIGVFLGTEDTSDGIGYWTAVGLGAVGAAALVFAIGQTVVPTVLHDGPSALKNARQEYDTWKIVGRLLLIAAGLLVAAIGAVGRVPIFVRAPLILLGLAWAIVFIVGSFASPMAVAPRPYLVPYGLILGGIGLLYLLTAIGTTDDTTLVVLTRRELAAYFYSPIAYIAIFGCAFVAAYGYRQYLVELVIQSTVPEPILRSYYPMTILAAFQAVFLVPALTMRLFAEERRTGTLEVLLTAPVSETAVVVSKFLAAWTVTLLCWLPAGIFLIAQRYAGGEAFDYRPVLSYYLAVAATTSGFVGMGLFFSSLTRNQVIAAVMTFAGMMGLLLSIWSGSDQKLGTAANAVLQKLDFLTLWGQSLAGQLPLTSVLVWASIGVFWLFLTVKVLEARKWS